MNKTLVTGGAGFIGSNLAKALLDKNHHVTVVDNFSQGLYENLASVKDNKNLEIVKADILDTRKMIKITKGVDVIFHLAVQCLRVSLNDPLFVERVNAGGTLSVLWAAHKNNARKFIYCSSSEVYGSAILFPMKEDHPLKPTTVYGASKLSGELYSNCFSENFGLDVVIVRPFNSYGYNEHIKGVYGEVIPRFAVRALHNLPIIIYGDGNQTRDFTFVTDTVDGIIRAGNSKDKKNKIFNIAYGEEISIRNIAEIIIKKAGSNSKIIFQPPRPHDVKRHFADISKAKKILGFKPKVNIEKGIELYINHLRKNKINLKKTLNDIPDRNW